MSQAPSDFEVTASRPTPGVACLAVSGELDFATVPQLRDSLEAFVDLPEVELLIDLTGCEFIDSSGIACLVQAWRGRGGDADGAGVHFCGVGDQLLRVLEVTGVAEVLTLHADRASALRAMRDDASRGAGTPA